MTAATGVDAAIVLTTVASGTDAVGLARTLVEERLAACVNILPPMTSVYRWQGRIEEEQEQQMLIKTTAERLPALEDRLRQLHPYDVPEFLVLRVAGGSDPYLNWVRQSVLPA